MEIQIQLMTEEQADNYRINPFDLTQSMAAQRLPATRRRNP